MSINNWEGFNEWGASTSSFNAIWYYTNLTGNYTMQKNVTGQKLVVFAFNRTTGVPTTGDSANITANISKDNGTSVVTTDTNPTETEGGYYSFDLTQAETNADVIQVFPSSTTTDIQIIATPAIIYTTPASFADGIVQTADHTSALASLDTKVDDLPTVSEFTARTLPTDSYFDSSIDSVTLNTAQPSITFQPMTITATGTQNNLTLSGAGTGDGLVFSRSGSGDLFDSNWVSYLESVVWDASLPSYSASGTTGEALGNVFTTEDYTAPDNASIAAILTDTSTTIPNQISGLNDLSVADVWNTQLTESYAADGIAPTATQALMLTQQFLTEFDITSTSYNVKRLDGTNTAATFTLNDDTNPTSITRS